MKLAPCFALMVPLLLPMRAIADPEPQPLPDYLQDRGTGVTTSLFGTYVRGGELLFYPFYEYTYSDGDEYHGSELGYTGSTDYLGTVREHEAVIYLAYGITEDLAFEFESEVYVHKTLEKADDDTTSGIPDRMKESGVGETELQLRWRFARETATRPEFYANLEVVPPLGRGSDNVLIGASDWEYAIGLGMVAGHSWGTLTPRISVVYEAAEDKVEAGEYAIEYLKRLSPSWRWVTTLEGESSDVIVVLEAQWHFSPRAYWKFNSGFGLTEKADDFAPEIGLMMSF